MAEQGPSADEGSDSSLGERPWRRWGRRGMRLLTVFVLLVALVLVLDLWVVRGPAQRSFLFRNIACLRCHPERIPQLSQATVHRPFLLTACTSCHIPHGTIGRRTAKSDDFSAWERLRNGLRGVGLEFVWAILSGPLGFPDPAAKQVSSAKIHTAPGGLRVPIEELCPACHPSLGPQLAMTYRHSPFVMRQCPSCHDPHASDYPAILKGTEETVCTACHPISRELEQAVVHRPFGELTCTACHRPHASDHVGMLNLPQRELCMGCHYDIGTLDGLSVRHAPFVQDCLPCHRPHSSPNIALLVETTPGLCYRCHADVRPEFDLPSAHPVGSRLSCENCHVPHASSTAGLLVASQRRLCPSCHPSVSTQLGEAVVHDPFSTSPCTSSCHRPHGSRFGPLLLAPDPALCYRCHSAVEGEVSKASSHPIGARMTCESCHKPHSSQVYSLLTKRLDGLCYDCHPKSGLFGARQKIPGMANVPYRDAGRAPSGGWPDDPYAAAKSPVMSGVQHEETHCIGCHRPHGSDYAPILKQSNPDVCLGCHRGYATRHAHPTTPAYYDTLAHKRLTCTSSCHNPHSSPYYRMLRYPYEVGGYGSDHLCKLCHSGVGVYY